MAQHRRPDGARERVVPGRRLEPREVGEQRGLDRLEELQRGARDEQRVEDDAGQDRARRAPHGQHGGVEQRLLGQLDPGDRQREPGPRAQGQARGAALELGLRRAGRAAVPARVADEHGRHDEQGDERGGDDPQRDGGLPGRQAHRDGDREAEARDRLEQHEARRRARTSRGRRRSRGRSSSRRRRASRRRRSSTARGCRRGPRAGGAARARRRGRRARSRPAARAGRAAGATWRPGRGGRAIVRERSCSTGR